MTRIPQFYDGSINLVKEQVYGRPLGLKFNEVTCKLYNANAHFGLMVVGRNGGVAKQLENSVEGVSFRFTNALDIDQCDAPIHGGPLTTRPPAEILVNVG